jgi:hypothetical protein
MIMQAGVHARVWGKGQMEVRAAMQWVPRRTMTEAWRRKQDHYAREVRDRQGERDFERVCGQRERESARTHTHTLSSEATYKTFLNLPPRHCVPSAGPRVSERMGAGQGERNAQPRCL